MSIIHVVPRWAMEASSACIINAIPSLKHFSVYLGVILSR